MTDQVQMNPAEKALSALLSHSLFGSECSLDGKEQLSALKEAEKQAVYALAAKDAVLPAEALGEVRLKSALSIRRNLEILSQHRYLHEIMSEADIPYMVLKGAASAFYYPDAMYRSMGDVDFLVRREDIPRATKALEKEGFTLWHEKHICHIVFRKENHHFEMHFEVAGIPEGKPEEEVRTFLADAIASATLVCTDHTVFMNPSPFHHGLVMLLHMQRHLLAEGIGLRHLTDWALFADRFSDEAFRSLFEDKLKCIGLWTFAQTISLAAHIGLGLPYRSYMGEDRTLASHLLSDILRGGNFGRKDRNRVNEGLFISNRGKDGVRHSRIGQLIRSVNQIVYTHWEISRKWKILLPLGWLWFGIRRLIREILGKRSPLHLLRSYRGSESRKEMYRQLHLFETEETEKRTKQTRKQSN